MGIPGVVVHKELEIKNALNEALKDEDIAVILITENLVKICRDFIYDIKLNHSKPLIVATVEQAILLRNMCEMRLVLKFDF